MAQKREAHKGHFKALADGDGAGSSLGTADSSLPPPPRLALKAAMQARPCNRRATAV